MAITVSVMIYIFVGVEDKTWAGQALDVLLLASYCINLFAFGLILWCGQYRYIVYNLIFLLLLCVFTVFAIISAFPGIGDRYGNNGVDTLAWIGLFNYLFLAAVLRQQFLPATVAVLTAFPVVAGVAYFYLSIPLRDEINKLDLAKVCVLRIAVLSLEKTEVNRIQSFSDIGLGMLIGEQSPRVIKILDFEAQIWRYGAREFSHLHRSSSLRKHCDV